ncbi:MAG: electron transport complex subunit RsxG [Gammaproteobacteria bacterium]|nr:electron transport complex subunit RsxG [Gammaproteobacteria bacterium]MBL6999247.1 electron transport complex subunit RsxG [Gammaproteobacteria bacterium]
MQINIKQIMISGFLLWLFSVIGTSLVAFTQQGTLERIAANEKRVLLRTLYELIPSSRIDNDIALDILEVKPSPLLGTIQDSVVYRARKNHTPVAVVFNCIASGGYSGDINLLVAVNQDGTLAGVRAVKHNETPGLGDAIEVRKSAWILGFDGRSLIDPPINDWKVKRDGGAFDQITGATITPRAIVRAVKSTLEYYQTNQESLFL